MNYIGSKHKLSEFIKSAILKVVGNAHDKVFADLFGGTGAVARSFKPEVRQVIINDMEPYSYVLSRNYIGNHRPFAYADYIHELNALKPRSGFVYTHYCPGGGNGRMYFSDGNGQKIDAIRMKIESWRKRREISEDCYYFLLASLLESADKVANTASVYGAFLKKLKTTAQKSLTLEPALFTLNDNDHLVYQRDANELVKEVEGDILYLDPPYNHRQYGANYHLLNTIALYDHFEPRGKTGLRDYNRSDYCKPRRVREVFDNLIREANFRYIFISYNNEGLMSADEVREILSKYGHYGLETTEYQRFKADKDSNRRHKARETTEYLHVLEKR